MSQPATMLADELCLVVSGPDASARLRAMPALVIGCIGLLALALAQLVHWAAPAAALALSALVWAGLSFELVVIPGKGLLRRSVGPFAWRTLDFGTRPRLIVWGTLEGDDLLIAHTGDEPIDPHARNTFWVGAKNDEGLVTFAAHANAEIARVSALR